MGRSDTEGLPLFFDADADDVLKRAKEWYDTAKAKIPELSPDKIKLLHGYDVPGMESAVAVCFWGRSGSFLLCSFLDGHDDVITLPMLRSEGIYPFFEKYQSLSIWEKLIAYPPFSEVMSEGMFFEGEFSIEASEYCSAVYALFILYGSRSLDWLNQRQRFFQFLHAAYAIGLNRRANNPRPVMVYAQHWTNDELASRFAEDFPQGKIIHTVRDPISGVDSWFDRQVEMQTWAASTGNRAQGAYLNTAVDTMKSLLTWGRAHRGLEGCTRAVRFEDLHVAPEATMRRLASWMGIAYHPCLLESTWNRVPYKIAIRGTVTCGSNPDNAKRRWKNLDAVDRLLIFALMRENFSAWNYPCPRWISRNAIRLFAISVLWLVPMKIELYNAAMVMRLQAWPALRRGKLAYAAGSVGFLVARRLRMMLLIATETWVRMRGRRHMLEIL